MEIEELFDLIVRTRPVILEILENQGYDSKPYMSQSPSDIITMAMGGPNPLRVRVNKRANAEPSTERAQVFYWVFDKVKMSLERRVDELWDVETYGENAADNETDQAVVILNEPLHDAFHAMAIRQWQINKRRIVFYSIKQLIINPERHILQPKFRKIPASEPLPLHNATGDNLHEVNTVERNLLRVKNKKNLPLIKFHVDIMTRVLGLVPDDIVEIIRSSPTTGDYKMYRICAI
jgi:DNA-directed RNA polymerase subunit H (RpoH/RPB5)